MLQDYQDNNSAYVQKKKILNISSVIIGVVGILLLITSQERHTQIFCLIFGFTLYIHFDAIRQFTRAENNCFWAYFAGSTVVEKVIKASEEHLEQMKKALEEQNKKRNQEK